jgi:hypothetical protein
MTVIKIPCRDIHYPHEDCTKTHWIDTETKQTWTTEIPKINQESNFTTDSTIVNPGESD